MGHATRRAWAAMRLAVVAACGGVGFTLVSDKVFTGPPSSDAR